MVVKHHGNWPHFPIAGEHHFEKKLTLGHLEGQAALLVHWRVVILNRGVDDRFFLLKPFQILDSNVWLLAGRLVIRQSLGF